jgi:hypothetical protein
MLALSYRTSDSSAACTRRIVAGVNGLFDLLGLVWRAVLLVVVVALALSWLGLLHR